MHAALAQTQTPDIQSHKRDRTPGVTTLINAVSSTLIPIRNILTAIAYPAVNAGVTSDLCGKQMPPLFVRCSEAGSGPFCKNLTPSGSLSDTYLPVLILFFA